MNVRGRNSLNPYICVKNRLESLSLSLKYCNISIEDISELGDNEMVKSYPGLSLMKGIIESISASSKLCQMRRYGRAQCMYTLLHTRLGMCQGKQGRSHRKLHRYLQQQWLLTQLRAAATADLLDLICSASST